MKHFWNKVNKKGEEECWEWTASFRSKSCPYGAFKFRGRIDLAHRVSYVINIGEIPEGMFVCHKCDNPKCVNPKHLFLGTARENAVDAYIKGRMSPPEGSRFKSGETHPNYKLSPEDIEKIKERRKMGWSLRGIAHQFGIDHSRVWQLTKK